MKETYYFPHDYSARNDDKILELRDKFKLEWYAIFWMLLETMAEKENGSIDKRLIGGLSLGYSIPKDTLIGIVDFCIEIGLFEEVEGKIFSKRMLEHKNTRKALSEAGKEGALRRRWNRGANGHPNAKGKERKGKYISKEVYLEKILWPIKIWKTDWYLEKDLLRESEECWNHYEEKGGIQIASSTFTNWVKRSVKFRTLVKPQKETEKIYANDLDS